MATYATGDILLLNFPYASGTGGVLRPGLVLLDAGDIDVLVAKITTRTHRSPFELALTDWRGAGLRVPSTVRLHKLATAEKTCVIRRVGKLTPVDHQSVSAILKSIFASW